MSKHLRPPFDDDALDRYWDDLVRGQQPSVQLPPDVTQALQHLSSFDPAPQSSTVRERAWAETFERTQPTPLVQELTSLPVLPISSNHRLPRSIPVAEGFRATPSPGRIDRRWAAIAALIAATLFAFVAYGYFDPFGSDPDNGPVIPAVVVQEATSIATPVGEHKITIDLPASMVHSTGAISAGWDYIEFPAKSTYEYIPYCCPGPFIEFVLIGQLTVQSAAPMTVIRADDSTESVPIGQDVTLLAGDAFLAENEAGLVATNNGEVRTQLLGWVLLNEEFSGHAAGGFPGSFDVDLKFDMVVTPGPGQVIVTRYDSLDQIPKPGPSSFQFVLQAYHTSNGTQLVRSTLMETEGTPIAGDGYDGFYVLDFLMSPPGTASPQATPGAGAHGLRPIAGH